MWHFLISSRNIKLDMIHDQHTGFFTKAMYAVYDAANADGGLLTLTLSTRLSD